MSSDKAALVIQISAKLDVLKEQLASVGTVINVSTGQMKRMVDTLQAGPVISQASKIVSAIQAMAGPLKLTADQAARFQKQVSDAISVLGDKAPPAFLQVQAQLQKLATTTEVAAQKTSVLDSTFAKMAGAFSAGSLIEKAVTGVLDFGKDAIALGGHLTDLSAKTGISTTALQKLGFVGGQVGVSLDTVADGVVMLQRRLAGGDEGALAAVDKLGLSVSKLLAEEPDRMFTDLSVAIGKIQDPAQRSLAAFQLLGREGANLIPVLTSDVEGIGKSAVTMSEETVAALDRLGDAWTELKSTTTAAVGTAVADIFRLNEAIDKLPPEISVPINIFFKGPGAVALGLANDALGYAGLVGGMGAQDSGIANSTNMTLTGGVSANIKDLDGILGKVQEKFKELPTGVQRASDALKAFEKENGTTAEQLKRVTDAIAKSDEAYQKFKRETLTGLTDAQRQQIEWSLRFQKETGQDVFVLGMYNDVLGRVLDATIKLNAHPVNFGPPPAPPFTVPVNNNPEIPGAVQIGSLGPAPGAPSQTIRDITYAIGLADQAMSAMTQHASAGWQTVAAGIGAATQAMQAYAAGASAASAASTAGIGFIIGQMISAWERASAEMAQFEDVQNEFRRRGFNIGTGGDIHNDAAATANVAAFVQQMGIIATHGMTIAQQLSLALAEFDRRIGSGIDNLGHALDVFGGHAPMALRPYIDSLLTSNRLTAEQAARLRAFATDPSWQDILAIAQKIGLAESDLGAGFQQLRVNDLAKTYFAQFTQLMDAHVDRNATLRAFADEIQDLINTSMSIPRFLKPMLDQMIALGLLNDPNGNRLADSLGLQFNDLRDPLQEAVDQLGNIYDVLGDIRDGVWAGIKGPLPDGGTYAPLLPGGGFRGLLSSAPSSSSMGAGTTTIVLEQNFDGRKFTEQVVVPNLPGAIRRTLGPRAYN